MTVSPIPLTVPFEGMPRFLVIWADWASQTLTVDPDLWTHFPDDPEERRRVSTPTGAGGIRITVALTGVQMEGAGERTLWSDAVGAAVLYNIARDLYHKMHDPALGVAVGECLLQMYPPEVIDRYTVAPATFAHSGDEHLLPVRDLRLLVDLPVAAWATASTPRAEVIAALVPEQGLIVTARLVDAEAAACFVLRPLEGDAGGIDLDMMPDPETGAVNETIRDDVLRVITATDDSSLGVEQIATLLMQSPWAAAVAGGFQMLPILQQLTDCGNRIVPGTVVTAEGSYRPSVIPEA